MGGRNPGRQGHNPGGLWHSRFPRAAGLLLGRSPEGDREPERLGFPLGWRLDRSAVCPRAGQVWAREEKEAQAEGLLAQFLVPEEAGQGPRAGRSWYAAAELGRIPQRTEGSKVWAASARAQALAGALVAQETLPPATSRSIPVLYLEPPAALAPARAGTRRQAGLRLGQAQRLKGAGRPRSQAGLGLAAERT